MSAVPQLKPDVQDSCSEGGEDRIGGLEGLENHYIHLEGRERLKLVGDEEQT